MPQSYMNGTDRTDHEIYTRVVLIWLDSVTPDHDKNKFAKNVANLCRNNASVTYDDYTRVIRYFCGLMKMNELQTTVILTDPKMFLDKVGNFDYVYELVCRMYPKPIG